MRCAIVLLVVGLTATVVLAEEPVYFPDVNLRAAVEAELGITDPTPTDMLGLTYLDAGGRGIVDLTGLEYAKNLTMLTLDGNQISDISPLSALTSLQLLWISNNQISDISPLSGLTNLQWLGMWSNKISNLTSLAGLIDLRELFLGLNQISDISPLSALTNLQEVSMIGNQISDISPLSGFTNLQYLSLWANPLNWEAYCVYIPIILNNNVGINMYADPNPYNCDTPETIIEHAAEAIADLEPENLNNLNSGMALINKIDATLVMIEEGFYAEALEKLQNDILQKTDGCATTGEPDSNDWILTCEDQEELYALIMQAIELLVNLIY